ncbi:terminase small subunit [Listeria booriae]|uniref:terminase small subunit n=1 Tax=Listeria booriae TaxID=1552123 RepID=UPI001626B414|nr:terminase small subunit [Listeria booriae]MBC1892433.1 terminase [Listeria booriae]MBC1974550.1 terminase [Listeria booriae]MBC1983482.1 terminase [Listeria booriae]MBC2031842.1 terminase [Listeria booriae]
MTKTEQKYKVFAQAYVSNGFNATEAAKTAGYSENGAEARGSNLLRNDKVLAFIDEEMNMLAKRMRDDASRIYHELWKQVRMIDGKLEKHEKSSTALSVLDARRIVLTADKNNLTDRLRRKERKLSTLDGRKTESKELVRELKNEISDLYLEIAQIKEEINDMKEEYSFSNRDALWHKDWKEILALRTTILQDLFDRSGYKDVSIRNFALVDAQIAKLNAGGNQEAAIEQTIIVSNADQMQAYLDAKSAKKAGDGDGENPDSSSD